jgi:DHA1 family inner membrane transport protein
VNTSLSPGRIRLALLALALGGFGIGATEFVAMGLLPNLAADLLPAIYQSSPEDALGQAGLLISAYALGVVVGAPTIAAVAARFPRKRLLLALLAIIVVATVASAILPSFGFVLAARFVSGLPHGAYFGVASLVAASLMGPGQRGRGIAFVLSGLTISNIVGVPLITLLGQTHGWRVAYLAVAGIFVLTFIAVSLFVPIQPGDVHATMRRELAAFRRSQVWLALGIGAIGFGGFFAVYTYISPVVTEVTKLPLSTVPIVLVVFGVGMTIGNLLGGRLADHHVMRTLFLCFALLFIALIGFALTAGNVIGLFAFAFLTALAASALSPAIQTRLMDVAGDSQTMAAAVNHSSLNLGNSLGAFLGGLAIAAGFGYLSSTLVGLALCVAGIGIAVFSALLQRVRPLRA